MIFHQYSTHEEDKQEKKQTNKHEQSFVWRTKHIDKVHTYDRIFLTY